MRCKHGNEIFQSLDSPQCRLCVQEMKDRMDCAIAYLEAHPEVCHRILVGRGQGQGEGEE